MADDKQASSSQGGKGKKEKKLRKREERLEERLLSARAELTNAEERFARAKERVNKRKERVERLEKRLAHLHPAQEEAPEESPQLSEQTVEAAVLSEEEVTAPLEEEVVVFHEAPLEAVEQEQAEAAMPSAASTVSSQQVQLDDASVMGSQIPVAAQSDEAIDRARIAREAAQAAEEAARVAIEHVYELMEHMEEFGYSRHLTEELAQLQDEADSAKQRALVAEQQARQLEQEAGLPSPSPSASEDTTRAGAPSVEIPVNNSQQQENTAEEQDPPPSLRSSSSPEAEEQGRFMPLDNGEQGVVLASSLLNREERFSSAFAQSGERAMPQALLPASMVQREQVPASVSSIKDIEEEEMSVEAVTALIVADAAAVAAAEAEALAEASSSRTREARLNAQEADNAVAQIRRDLELGVLSGDEAEAALLAAEQQATHAHAALADAEAAEERARRVAMDAEAEAEVAEGMAFATEERSEYAEEQDHA
jgi:hypothetical protein